MRIVSLASGSSGNAILVDSGATRILVDCGIGPRVLKTRLVSVGVRPDQIDAVLVTHEHQDHVRGVPFALARWPWTVIGSAGTLRRLPQQARTAAGPVQRSHSVGDFEIAMVPVSHDASEPTAFIVTDRATGRRAGIAHDLGQPSDALISAFRGVDLLCIEANHDVEMLRRGPYSPWLKNRVASATGHLSNDQTTAFIDAVATKDLRAVLLLHLSQVNNTPLIACAAAKRGISHRAKRALVAAAGRKSPSAAMGERHSGQLALAI